MSIPLPIHGRGTAENPSNRFERIDIVLDDTNTRKALAESAISCPPIDKTVLSTYIEAFQASGFLPTPPSTGDGDRDMPMPS